MAIRQEDAYGRLIYDHHRGVPSAEIIERDDGWVGTSSGAPACFAPFEAWPTHQRQALRYARGRCLDVGCGAGRVALQLQARGHDVVAIDASPLAVRISRRRGVQQARVLRFTQVDARLGCFDTIVMYGNNFGLLVSPTEMERIVTGTGWNVARFVRSRGPVYIAVLEKVQARRSLR